MIYNVLMGLLTLLVLLWILFYVVPDVFGSLFYSLLGNIVSVGLIILVGMRNVSLGIFLSVVYILLFVLLRNH